MKRKKGNGIGQENCLSEPTPASVEAVFSNEDLLEEILLRVPAKSLVRMKCVSMHWLRLISTPRFGYKHATQNLISNSALYYQLGSYSHNDLKAISLCGNQSLPTLSFLNGIERRGPIIVLHARNGLMLCYYDCPQKYIICNLTTQKYFILCPPNENEGYLSLCSLAYDPAVSPYYKVLLIRRRHFRYSKNLLIDVYSSQTSSWKRVHAPGAAEPPTGNSDHPRLTAFCNGAIHWICPRAAPPDHSDMYFRFEVDTEKLLGSPLPSGPRMLKKCNVQFFGECGGSLLLIQQSCRYVVGIGIFQMDMENCRWISKQYVRLRPIEPAFPGGRIRFNLLAILQGSREDDIIAVLAIKGKVIAYYPGGNAFKVISNTSPDDFVRKAHLQKGGAYQHFESLAPV